MQYKDPGYNRLLVADIYNRESEEAEVFFVKDNFRRFKYHSLRR